MAKPGPIFQNQMQRLGLAWHQGGHVLITGGTGSGKTRLAREILEQRIQRGGFVVVFVCKLGDETIDSAYKGFKRWKTWKDKPRVDENRILLWPAVEGLPMREALKVWKA